MIFCIGAITGSKLLSARCYNEPHFMKLAGLLLLPSGCFIALSAIVLLAGSPAQTAFVLAGCAVEILGLGLVVRSHLSARGNSR